MGREIFRAYTDEYIEQCFATWYGAGRPRFLRQIIEKLPLDEHGRRPSLEMLKRWRQERGWDLRADDLDARAQQIADEEMIAQRAEMLKRQAQVGFEMQQRGLEYLREHGFDSSASAVNAIVRGVEIEQASADRTGRGLIDVLRKISKMTDDEIQKEIQRLFSSPIIDMEVAEDE